MSGIKIVDERKYPLPNANNDILPYYRWEHRATIQRHGVTYLVFLDNGVIINGKTATPPQIYIEELSNQLKYIEDDQLFQELMMFVKAKGLIDLQKPIYKG